MGRKRGPPDDYEVGRNKPPKETQFKPGRSGNPRGRPPRKTRSKREIYREKGDELVTVIRGGRRQQSRRIDLIIDLEYQAAQNGDRRARRDVIENYPWDDDRPGDPRYYVPAPDGRGTRLVQFELTEEELLLIDGVRDTLAQYYPHDEDGEEDIEDTLPLAFGDDAEEGDQGP